MKTFLHALFFIYIFLGAYDHGLSNLASVFTLILNQKVGKCVKQNHEF